MAGIRIGGAGAVTYISPPFSDWELSDGDTQVWRHVRPVNAPGEAFNYTDWNDGATTITEIYNPVLSPDGTMIAYVGRLDSTGFTALYVCANAANSPSTLLEDDAATNINTPMWSPDSSTIVFTRGDPPGDVSYGGSIETIPAAGGSPTVLYTPSSGFAAFRPAYSFDGDFIAFILQEFSGTGDGLWVMEDDGSNAAEIDSTVNYAGQGTQFGWANSERTIAFYDGAGSSSGATGDAWVIAHDGTGKTQMSNGATNGTRISVSRDCWLPDDSAVVFGSNQGGGIMSIYSGDPAGGAETLLNGTNGPVIQQYCTGVFVYRNRLWFIRQASNANTGVIGSTALDGTGYVEELDVTDGSLIDWFGSGAGFEFQ